MGFFAIYISSLVKCLFVSTDFMSCNLTSYLSSSSCLIDCFTLFLYRNWSIYMLLYFFFSTLCTFVFLPYAQTRTFRTIVEWKGIIFCSLSYSDSVQYFITSSQLSFPSWESSLLFLVYIKFMWRSVEFYQCLSCT